MIEYAFDAEEGKAVMKRTNEVSKLVGVSRRTLQYYDDEGLLGAKRSELNYRLYDQQALEPSGQGRWLIMCPYWLDMCPCKKKSESSRKELSGLCVCLFECNRVEKRTKFRKLEPPGTLIWPQCLSPMVLAMTANAFEEDAKQCFAAGMNAHIAKPIDIEFLEKTLQRIYEQL